MLIKVPYCGAQTITTLLVGYRFSFPNVDDANFPVSFFGKDEVVVEFPELPLDQGLAAVDSKLRELKMRALNAPETLVLGLELPTSIITSLGQRLSPYGVDSHALYTFSHEAKVNDCRPKWLRQCRVPATRAPNPLLGAKTR